MTRDQARRFAAWAGLARASARALEAWEAVPLQVHGKLAGLGAVDGTEIHFALSPAHRESGVITRKRCRDWLAPLFERRGFLTTRAFKPTTEQLSFLGRLGFEWTRADGDTHFYMLCELPFERRT